jgi:hypothetical protein
MTFRLKDDRGREYFSSTSLDPSASTDPLRRWRGEEELYIKFEGQIITDHGSLSTL